MANRWTDDEKETLYLVAQNYHEEINQYQTVEPTSEIIQTIYQSTKSSRDTKAILYKLEEMGFLRRGSHSYQDNIFIVNHLKQSDFLNFSISPSYKSLTPSKSIEFKNCFQQTALKINDIDELCSAIACSLSL